MYSKDKNIIIQLEYSSLMIGAYDSNCHHCSCILDKLATVRFGPGSALLMPNPNLKTPEPRFRSGSVPNQNFICKIHSKYYYMGAQMMFNIIWAQSHHWYITIRGSGIKVVHDKLILKEKIQLMNIKT